MIGNSLIRVTILSINDQRISRRKTMINDVQDSNASVKEFSEGKENILSRQR